MKKLVLFFAVIVAVSFASCGKKQAAPAEEVTADSTVTAVSADTAASADTAVTADSAVVAK